MMKLLFKFLNNLYNQNTREHERVMLALLEENPDAKFIDYGCYDGEFTMRQAQKIGTRKVCGIESGEESYRQSQSKGIDVIKGDLNQTLPIESETFDVICASHVIEHLCDTDTFIREMFRIMKPDGYVIISTPNLASPHSIFMLLLGKQPPEAHVSDEIEIGSYHVKIGKKPSRGYPAHRRLFTFEALKELLEYYGFEVERTIGSGFFPFPVSLARVMCLIDKRHVTHINIKARKRSH